MVKTVWILAAGLFVVGCGGSEASHLYAPDLQQGDAGDDLSDAASNEPPDVEVEAGTGTGTGAQCVPGHQANCMCPNQTWGWQVCANDGSHYSACQCPSPKSDEEDEEDEWEEPLPPEQDAGAEDDPHAWPPDAGNEEPPPPPQDAGSDWDPYVLRCQLHETGKVYTCAELRHYWGHSYIRYKTPESFRSCYPFVSDPSIYYPHTCFPGTPCTVYLDSSKGITLHEGTCI